MRLYSHEMKLKRSFPRQFRSKEQIGKSDMVDRKLGVENSGDCVSLNGPDVPGWLAEVDGVNDEDAVLLLKERQQIESHGPAVDDCDLRRECLSLLQDIDCVHPNAFIGQQDIAEAEYCNFPLLVDIHTGVHTIVRIPAPLLRICNLRISTPLIHCAQLN